MSHTRLNRRFKGIWDERQSFEDRWKSVAQYVDPTTDRFDRDQHNKGDRTRSKILDATATRALRVAQSGLLAGMASPARPWFTLATRDPALDEDHLVQSWLEDTRDRALEVLDRSNFYQSLGVLFADEMKYATAAMGVFEDPDRVLRFQVFPVGSYAIAQDDRGRVNALVREMRMTVAQAAQKFGAERLSVRARMNLQSPGKEQSLMTVRHAVWRRTEGLGRPGVLGLPWQELYWEWEGPDEGRDQPDWDAGATVSGDAAAEMPLSESGYHEFPFIVARWAKNDDDVYGTGCPAFDALGDIKELQAQRRAYGRAQAKTIDPPLSADPGLEGRVISLMAGEVTFGGSNGNTHPAVRPIHEVRYDFANSLEAMAQLRQAIQEAFLVPVWQMLLQREGQPLTATEVSARLEEKAAILGPILERHSDDVFDPLIDRVLGVMLRRSTPFWELDEPGALIDPPPESLEGHEVRPVYVSEIAQAQKLQGLGPLERHVNFVGAMANVDPQILDTLDIDEVAREHAQINGVPAAVQRAQDDVEAIRAQRAEMARQQAEAERAATLAGAARDLSGGQPLLTDQGLNPSLAQ